MKKAMYKPYIAALLLVLGVAAVAVGVQVWPDAPSAFQNVQEETQAPATSTGKHMGIEAYVTAFISELSPIKEQVGGTFFVTQIDITNATSGTVEYEDGHNAYVADFTYTVDPETARPSVTSFRIRGN